MSSFTTTAMRIKDGSTVRVDCLDDYFGRHQYGYVLPDGTVLKQEQFFKEYETQESVV